MDELLLLADDRGYFRVRSTMVESFSAISFEISSVDDEVSHNEQKAITATVTLESAKQLRDFLTLHIGE